MEIVGFECFLRQRITRITVEPGGYANDVGFEFGQALERGGKNVTVFTPGRLRRHRVIEAVAAHIASTGARVTRKLVDGEECRAGMVQEDSLRPVSMVD